MTEKRKPGRPRIRDVSMLPAEYVGFRASGELKRQLEAAAKGAGRSLSAEAQFRLEMSFRDDRLEGRLDEIIALIKPARRVA